MHPKLILARVSKGVRSRAAALLQSGLTPQQLSLTLCLGTALGVMPLLWGTTLLCALVAARLKLNQAAMQAVNYCCYPLQLALFLPFCRLGELLFPWGGAVRGEMLTEALHGHLGGSLSLLALATARGVGGWFVTILPLVLLVYPVLKGVLRKRGKAGAMGRETGDFPLAAGLPLPDPPPPGEGS